jgi:thiol-disulfide isomerase/thioredoxin
LALAAVVVATAAGSLPAVADEGRVAKRDSAIAFGSDLDEALEDAKAAGKPVFLAFGAVWCPVCRRMEEQTLLEAPVQAFADAFVWVKIDIDRNRALAQEWEVEATPTIYLLDPEGSARRKIVGGASADELAALLQAFLDDLGEAKPEAADAGEEMVFERTQLTMTPQGYRGKSICFSHVGYGPLSVRSQSAFQSLRLGILPRTPSTLGRGQHQIRAGATWANTWANDDAAFDPDQGQYGEYFLDFESLDLALAYAYGVSDTIELGVEYEQRWRFGGAMDAFIQNFHDLFGLDQSGRELVPRNQIGIFLDPRNGNAPVDLGSEASGTFARSILLTFQHNLSCGTAKWPAVSYSISGRYSLGDFDELEGDGFDVAMSVSASRRLGRFYVYMTVGYAVYASEEFYGIELEDSQLTLLAAAEWRFKPRMSLILQYLGTEGQAVDFGPFSETSNEIVVGWKWEAAPGGVLEVGLIENVVTFDNSPDFGVHAAWTQRF